MNRSSLTKRQRKALHKRIVENNKIVRKRVGAKLYDKVAKVVKAFLKNK